MCDVCDACVSQEHDGRRAAKCQADDDRESNSQPTPRLLSATIYSFRNVHVLMNQLACSTHGNDGTTVELPAWLAYDEAFVRRASVNWEVFRAVKDRSLTALTALNAFRHPSCFTDVGTLEKREWRPIDRITFSPC
jgi:hypothetical protein